MTVKKSKKTKAKTGTKTKKAKTEDINLNHIRIANPDGKYRYHWDFWYVRAPHPKTGEEGFCVMAMTDSDDGPAGPGAQIRVKEGKHHFVADLSLYFTKDFRNYEHVADHIFQALPKGTGWDDTSIWSGSVIQTMVPKKGGSGHEPGYALFYTSRTFDEGDGFTQHIGIAYSPDMLNWTRLKGFKLSADPGFYMTCTNKEESTIHAWRDPYLFKDLGNVYMVVAAKHRKAQLDNSACVALLQATDDSLTNWEHLGPFPIARKYSEMEVPKVYRDNDGALLLVFATGGSQKKPDRTETLIGGLHAVRFYMRNGFPDLLSEEELERGSMYFNRGENPIYAGGIVSEFGGMIVGFDIKRGGFGLGSSSRNIPPQDRDFTDCKLRMS